MGDLADFVKNNSPWLKLDDGESITCKFLGYAFVINKSGNKVPAYEFQLKDGSKKTLQSQSAVLANFFDKDKGSAKPGNKVSITRIGKNQDTRYQVELIITDDLGPDTNVPF